MTFGSVQSQREAVPLGPAVASHCEPRLCSALRHPTLTPATTTTTTTTTSLSIIVHDKARHNQKKYHIPDRASRYYVLGRRYGISQQKWQRQLERKRAYRKITVSLPRTTDW